MVADLVLQTLRHVVETLDREDLTWAVVGGVALSVWDHARYTRDIDFLLGVDGKDLNEIYSAFRAAGLCAKHDPPTRSVGEQRFAQFLYQPLETYLDIQVDFILAEIAYQRQALDRRVAVSFPDWDNEVYVLACEDLIVFKLVSGPIIDLADAGALLRANENTLDVPLLRQVCERNGLGEELSRIWEEAFPRTSMPGGSD